MTGVYAFTFFGAMLSFGLGTYLFTCTQIDDIKGMLRSFDGCAKLKRNKKRILKQLFEYIRLHSDMKQLNNNFKSHIKSLKMCLVLI